MKNLLRLSASLYKASKLWLCIGIVLVVIPSSTNGQDEETVATSPLALDYEFEVEEGIDDSVSSNIVSTLAKSQTLVKSISTTGLEKLFLVRTTADDFLYLSSDGKYLFLGDLFELQEEGFTNLTEELRQDSYKEILASVDTIDFAPEEGDTKYVVHVFTDITCGYCRQLHRRMNEYNELGIEIRYLAYPRAGKGSESYIQMVSAWCSEDPKAAMTLLKNGKSIDTKDCENTVDQQMSLASKMGLRGTPMLVVPSGQTVPGAVDPERLLGILQQLEDS